MKKQKQKQKQKHTKPQYGVTYECCASFTDFMGNRARKGQKYYFYTTFGIGYSMLSPSNRGNTKIIEHNRFMSHFIPLNPLS
jgi:hypothetical protein